MHRLLPRLSFIIMSLIITVLFVGCWSQSDRVSEKLKLELNFPQTVAEGSAIYFDLTLVNSSNDEVKIWLGHPIWDFVIRRGDDGGEVWRWSNSKKLSDLVERRRSLGAQAVLKCGYRWDMKDNQGRVLPEGRYTATGVFNLYGKSYTADDPPTLEIVTSAPVPFSVTRDASEISRFPGECDPPLIEITEIPKPTLTP